MLRRIQKLTDKQIWLIAALLTVLGCVLRLYALGALPWGLNQDEASAGYEAWALLHSGIDRCGDPWPVLFTSWGSGQNVLMSYLAMPGIALGGLSELTVRLPNAVLGCLTLPLMWLLARRARGEGFGLTALFLLAVNPWHIMMSRWGLESNLLPFFLLLGTYLTALAKERPWWLVGAAASFALALYAYGTAFFFLPFYLIFALLWLRRSLRPASFFTALGVFILLALPVALCQLINVLGRDEVHVLGMTLPKLTEGRQAATSIFGGGGLAAAAENFRGFLRILLTGSDGLVYNALPRWRSGIFYFFGLPTAVLGVIAALFRRKDFDGERPVLLALLAALLCAFFIQCNINRINMVWLPLVYFSALGCHVIFRALRGWSILPLLGILVCCGFFVKDYAETFAQNVNYFPGLGAAVEYAAAQDAETVYITDFVNQPYIFALFYTETPPEDFVSSVEYRDENAAFRQVQRFAGFEFESAADAELRILPRWQTEGEVLFTAGDYAVCRGG